MRKTICRLSGSLILSAALAGAQQLDMKALDAIDGIIDNVIAKKDTEASIEDNIHRVILVRALGREVGGKVSPSGSLRREDVMRQLRFRRSDVQTGASSSASGSTSAVMNPLLPAILGFSVENGSILRSISGTTTTFKINPAGLFCASSDDPDKVEAARLRDSGCADTARRLAFSVAFDGSRSDSELDGLRPLRDQFSELSARFELVNRRTPKGKRFNSLLEAWNQRARQYLPPAVDLNDAIIASNAWRAFVNASGNFADSELAKAVGVAQSGDDQEQAKRVLKEKLLAVLNAALEEPAVKVAVKPAPATADAYWQQVKANRHIFNQINHAWTASLEYALERPAIATEAIGDVVPEGIRPPDLHTVRLIAAKGLSKANLDFTVNLSSSWFGDARVMNKGSWRDFRVGAEGRLLLRQIPDFGRPVVTFAGLWMHLNQEPLGLGIQAFNEAKINQPGNIGLFQGKLEVPTANAAVKIPLSFTYANRTELIKESDVRGQIGITLDLDTFFSN